MNDVKEKLVMQLKTEINSIVSLKDRLEGQLESTMQALAVYKITNIDELNSKITSIEKALEEKEKEFDVLYQNINQLLQNITDVK